MQGANSLGRLNEMLFAELERLAALDVTDQAALDAEVARSRAIQGLRTMLAYFMQMAMAWKSQTRVKP